MQTGKIAPFCLMLGLASPVPAATKAIKAGKLIDPAGKVITNAVVVIDNERYGETGMQETHTAHGVDLAAMARAAGFASGVLLRDAAGVAALRNTIHQAAGPHFVQVKVAAEKVPLVLPPREGALLKSRFRAALLGGGAALQ